MRTRVFQTDEFIATCIIIVWLIDKFRRGDHNRLWLFRRRRRRFSCCFAFGRRGLTRFRTSYYLSGSNCAAVLQSLGTLPPGKGCPGDRAINPSAFEAVNSGLGDTPRNFARLFGAWQMNLAVRRSFPIGERVRLQFRAEAFNIFNHPNFGSVYPYFGATTFGQATATLANSLGVVSPLYQMGGPRSMQFALKLVF